MGEYAMAESKGVKGSDDNSERREKQARFDKDGECKDECLDPFRNEMGIQVVEEFLRISASSPDGGRDV